MTIYRQLCCFTIIFLWSIHSPAQQKAVPLGLAELLNSVDRYSPTLAADSAAILIKRLDAVRAEFNRLPDLHLGYQVNVGSNNNVAGPYMAFGIVPSNSRGVRPMANSGAALTNLGIASLNWELSNFGAYRAERKLANAEVKNEESRFRESRYQIRALAIDNYLMLSRLQELKQLQVRTVARNERIVRSIGSLAKSGIRPGVDTSIAAAELSRARLTYIELENSFLQVQQELSLATGIKAPLILADTGMLESLGVRELNLLALTDDSVGHPLVNVYYRNYRTSLDRQKVVENEYNPKLSLQAAVWSRGSSIDANDQFNHLSSGLDWQRGNYFLGIGLSYNLFDLKRRKLKLNVERSNTSFYRRKLEEQQGLLANAAANANTELLTAHKRLLEIPKQLKAATAGYRQKLALYSNGLTDIVELNAALSILNRAETDYVDARYRYVRAFFQKAIATNQLDTVLKLIK